MSTKTDKELYYLWQTPEDKQLIRLPGIEEKHRLSYIPWEEIMVCEGCGAASVFDKCPSCNSSAVPLYAVMVHMKDLIEQERKLREE